MSTPVWFVTGAATGFGHEISAVALKRGHRVIATGRHPEQLADLRSAGAHTMAVDVNASQEAINDRIKEAVDVYGRIDYVINAAGYALTGTLEDCSEKEIFDQFNTNVFGTIRVVKAVTPYFHAQKGGTIANFGSLGSWTGEPAVSLYCATKWAVTGLTESLKKELEPLNITVTVIEPGYFRTAFLNDGKRNGAAAHLSEPYRGTSVEDYLNLLDQVDGKQPGDVSKAGPAIVDILTKSGVAKGRPVPLRIALGTDILGVIREKCETTTKLLKEWEDVFRSTDHVN